MNAVAQVFRFEANEIRTAMIAGDPRFVAADLCDVLGLANRRSSLALLDEDEKGVHTMDTPGGQQQLAIVNEPGMYSLILRSRKPEAKKFKRWITHDVLPAIRKAGRYEVEHATPQSFADALQLAADQAREIERQQAAIEVLEPKAAQADHHRAADGLTAIGDFANELKAWARREHNVRIKHEQVWDFLGEIGLIIRGDTVRRHHPTAFATERDFVRKKTTEFETNTRGLQASVSPRLTPAGEGWAWDRAVNRIASHGSLAAPTKAIEGAKA